MEKRPLTYGSLEAAFEAIEKVAQYRQRPVLMRYGHGSRKWAVFTDKNDRVRSNDLLEGLNLFIGLQKAVHGFKDY